MFEYVPTEYARIFFIVCLIALAVIALVCLVRAILGPKFTDRIMAVNMIGHQNIVNGVCAGSTAARKLFGRCCNCLRIT